MFPTKLFLFYNFRKGFDVQFLPNLQAKYFLDTARKFEKQRCFEYCKMGLPL